METISVIGLDLAKNVFQVHCADEKGCCLQSKALRRAQLLQFFAMLKPCLVGMEACGSSHYWARQLQMLGHDVRLMAPQYVKAYVKTNKNDAADAEAICEAVTRPGMRFVDIKTEEQQAILLLHRDREGLTRDRTALINRLRATLAEFGVVTPTGPQRLKHWFQEDYSHYGTALSALVQRQVERMRTRLRGLDGEIAALDVEIDLTSRSNEACQRLEAVPSIGRLTASALVATVGKGQSFKSGRQFAAWLGLVPRQHSSGGKSRLLGISKRGDGYLRRMLIHGARAVIRHMNPKRSVTGWLAQLSARTHHNVVIVALANKLARIAWAMQYRERTYSEALVAGQR
ncbi:IS110 family transposase [Marinobacter changyiensis]|uniref:IS110 family transposase n=1 Tax=Marinobacter changyiensis TaxID=2604091 RepID=UPI001264E8D7|nr:IS110 family transposase [Marinobacter changyiensis]